MHVVLSKNINFFLSLRVVVTVQSVPTLKDLTKASVTCINSCGPQFSTLKKVMNLKYFFCSFPRGNSDFVCKNRNGIWKII
jgi:hypothetical protein